MLFLLKGAALVVSLQMIGLTSDEAEDRLQDCPIFIELAGLGSKTSLYVGITVGVVIAAVVGFCVWKKYGCNKTATEHEYNKTPTEHV